MANEPTQRVLGKRLVLAINRMCVELSGGLGASRSNLRPGQALGFVEGVYYNEVFGQRLYRDQYEQAAAYLFHIVKTHPFLDGNKRTGLCCALTLLEWNGMEIRPLPEDPVFEHVMGIAAGPNDAGKMIPEIAAWLRAITTFAPPAAVD